MEQFKLGLEPLPEMTRKEVFPGAMNQFVPWGAVVAHKER